MTESIILGVGFRQSAQFKSFQNAVEQIQPSLAYDVIAVPDDKQDHQMLQAFANHMALRIIGVPQAVIAAMKTPTQSDIIHKKRQTGSFAEAAALAILHHPARLLVTRCISGDRLAVCAVAKGVIL